MSLFYRTSYRLGFTPWEHAAAHPPAAHHILRLFDRESSVRPSPDSTALDLGCGRGHWSIELASRGWRVTGVDTVAAAISEARRHAGAAGLNMNFVEADVTALRAAGIDGTFRLFLDFGTLHGLTRPEFTKAGDEVTALAAPDATLLMLAWTPGRRGPLPRGVGRDEIEAAYPGWRIEDVERFDATGLPPPLRRVDPRIYRLRRD